MSRAPKPGAGSDVPGEARRSSPRGPVPSPAGPAPSPTGPASAPSPTSERLPLVTKLIFGAGDLFGGGASSIVGFFYLIFLTDVVQIRPVLAGGAVLVSRVWDAVSDPLMGVLSDRTRTRFGRRRPYFLAGSVLVFISYALLWQAVGFASEWARFAYVLSTYLLFSTVTTLVMVPYSAMSAELTLDYDERTRLNSVRLAFSTISSLIAAVLPMVVVQGFPEARTGYAVMGAAFGLAFALPWLGIFLHCRERASFQRSADPFNWAGLVKEPLRIRSFRLLIVIYLMAFLTVDVLSAVFAYYMTYYLGRPGELNLVLGTVVLAQVVFLPVHVHTSRLLSKPRAFVLAAIVAASGTVAIFFLPTGVPIWGLVALAGWVGAGMSGAVLLPWTIFPDVTDVGELAYGARKEGSFSGFMTFFRKASSAVALFLVSLGLQLAGYVQPREQVVDGVTRTVQQVQPDAVLWMIRALLGFLPVLLLGAGIWAAWRFPLTPAVHARLRAHLAFARGDAASTPLIDAQVAQLKEDLI